MFARFAIDEEKSEEFVNLLEEDDVGIIDDEIKHNNSEEDKQSNYQSMFAPVEKRQVVADENAPILAEVQYSDDTLHEAVRSANDSTLFVDMNKSRKLHWWISAFIIIVFLLLVLVAILLFK